MGYAYGMKSPAKPASRATSHDVARLAGVSQSAVSRCFKPGASISKKMREKVMAAAKELHYQPNAIARSLISQRSDIVAILIHEQMGFYYPEVLFQLSRRFSNNGLRALLFTIGKEEDVEEAIAQIWRYQADGVIAASTLSTEQHQLLAERQIPVVMFNRYFYNLPTNTIWCDTEAAVNEMVFHLRDFGHRKFGLLKGPHYSMVSNERMRLVRDAVKAQGGAIVAESEGNYRYESAASATQDLMASKSKPTVVIAANDMMAMGAMDELRNIMGLKIPRDISVVGFDGTGTASFASYEITTIRQPIGRMAEAAVRMMVHRIEKPDTSLEKLVLSASFVQGTSTGPVKKSK